MSDRRGDKSQIGELNICCGLECWTIFFDITDDTPQAIKAGLLDLCSSVSARNYAISDRFFTFNGADAPKNVSAGEWDIEEGCKCMNGRCEKLCVKERNGVCRKTSNVCVCGPEYFKANDETCINCECGKGFNCTFYHVTRTCTCPEGFYIRDDKCAALCDESHPCQNGGKCIDGKCQCKTGTSGAFCESPDRCEATCNQPLLVECVYNEEKEDVYCLCKNRSLVYDFELGICKRDACAIQQLTASRRVTVNSIARATKDIKEEFTKSHKLEKNALILTSAKIPRHAQTERLQNASTSMDLTCVAARLVISPSVHLPILAKLHVKNIKYPGRPRGLPLVLSLPSSPFQWESCYS
ncbi:Delta-like protein A like protein [Argiope bruennichi]|uniref:Delta-like protein A like protein n=1 Tax=Argiope bruennichi TaxID=94029 RepID=A0A8T0G5S9_ARGBR|nr:Delta-like protein A like protein [Argiope bruennichi]